MIKIASSDKKLQKFIDDVTRTLKKHRYDLVLSLDELDINGNSVGGSFDPDTRELAVDITQEGWEEVLIHEYAHCLLHIKNSKEKNRKEGVSSENLWKWLEHSINPKNPDIKRFVRHVMRMELAAEKLTVKMIKKYKLDIDLDVYIRKANAYIYFYNYVYLHRTWFKDDFYISECEELMNSFPANFKFRYYELDKNLLELYRPHVK